MDVLLLVLYLLALIALGYVCVVQVRRRAHEIRGLLETVSLPPSGIQDLTKRLLSHVRQASHTQGQLVPLGTFWSDDLTPGDKYQALKPLLDDGVFLVPQPDAKLPGQLQAYTPTIFGYIPTEVALSQRDFELMILAKAPLQMSRDTYKTINIGAGAHVTAPVTIADAITESFNQIADSQIDSGIAELLTQLTRNVAELTQHAPTEIGEQMTRDLATLTKEAAASAPRRSWCTMALEGIRTTATELGDAAAPVLALVDKLSDTL